MQAVKPGAVEDVEHQRQLLRAIIKAFVDDRLVGSPDNVISFALTDDSLTINGQRQPGVGFYFGPVTMTGTGIFMDRDDLHR